MARPLVSVVIPHYGDPAPTSALVEWLLRMGPHEVIVVDDCSPTPFPDAEGVRVVRRTRNGGFGTAVNSGAELASGQLLAILNSDLAVPESFLDALVDAAGPWQPCVAGPRITDEDDDLAFTARRWPLARHQIVEWLTPLARWRGTPRWREGVGYDLDATASETPRTVDWLVGAALLVPTAPFRAVGGFDERFYMNAEEVDLQRRLAAQGVPAVYVPGVTVRHASGGSSDPGRRRRWLVDARLTYSAKWGGRTALRAGLTTASGVNLAWNAGRRLLGRPIDPIAVVRDELALIWKNGRP